MIADRAEGVFLWVHLILSGLSERIVAGYAHITLQKYAEDFPKELYDYFRHLIYDRISPCWR